MKRIILLIFISKYLLSAAFGQVTIDSAVNFSGLTPYGETLGLYSYLDDGKIVMLEFFRPTWGTCITYAPDIVQAYEEFGCNEGNVVFMAVGRWCTDEQVIGFDEDHGIEFPSMSGDAGGTGVFNDYGVTSTPTLCIIHPDRTILEKIIWPPTKDNIVQKLTENGGITQECSTGITENNSLGEFSVHPNPATSDATLNFELYENENIYIEIIDLLGKQVVKIPDQEFFPGINEVNLNLSNVNKGIYFIKISNPNTIFYTQKLIVR